MPEEPSGGPRRSFTGQRRKYRRKKRIGSALLRPCFAVIAVKFIEHQLTARHRFRQLHLGRSRDRSRPKKDPT